MPPPLRFDVLEEVSKRLPGFPIVLHGSSSVPQEYVKMINENGGKMPNAIGVPEEQLRQAAKLSVCKINIDSDLRLAMTGTIRKFFDEHPDKFDPARVPEARPCQHQGAGPPQARGRPRLRRQGLIWFYRIDFTPNAPGDSVSRCVFVKSPAFADDNALAHSGTLYYNVRAFAINEKECGYV